MTTTSKKTAKESVNEVNNTTAQQQPQEMEMLGAFGEDYSVKITVSKVIAGKYPNRVAFAFDGTPIAGFDENNNEAAVQTFGVNVNELCNQVRNQVPELAMFETAAMGGRIPVQVIGFIFSGAELEVERVYKEKGEQREATDDTYTANCFVTKVRKVKTHITQQVTMLLNTMLMQMCTQSMQPVAANPFNVR